MAKKTGKTKKQKAVVNKKTTKKSPKPSVVKQPITPKQLKKLPPSWRIFQTSVEVIWRNKLIFGGITAIYALLNLFLVRGFSGGTDVGQLKAQLTQAAHGNLSQLRTSFSVFNSIADSSNGTNNGAAGAYQFCIGIVFSLAIIWTLRQILALKQVTVKDAYYRSMYPLVPFVLVFGLIVVQLLPAFVGSAIYGLVIGNGIAVLLAEKVFWVLVLIVTAGLSLYMISSSIFGLYIVTLANMTPVKAARSARELVRGRRWSVIRKLLFLPFVSGVVTTAIMLPVIIIVAALAQWVFFTLSMFSLVFVHSYLYVLYRELLNE